MSEPERRPGGRTSRTTHSVLEATLAELIDHGYVELGVEAVAARAGVHKTTVYRRWESKQRLVLDALRSAAADALPAPDTGDLESDLRLLARSVVELLTNPVGEAAVRAMVSASSSSPELSATLRDYWAARMASMSPVVDRARSRGEVPAGTDAAEVVKAMGAPLYLRLLVTAEPLDDEVADRSARAAAVAARAGAFVAGAG